jgi:hypothetical protein
MLIYINIIGGWMNTNIDIYRHLYGYLDKTTPMQFDCGLLCNTACCAENGLGMLLFPGEAEYLESLEHEFTIVDSEYNVNGIAAKLLKCNGICNRSKRPLSCRIFPLFPYCRDGRITIGFDPRAKGTCPLLFEDIEGVYIRGIFRLKILQIAQIMCNHESLKEFLECYTKELDEISRFRF